MTEITLDQSKAQAIAATRARLESVLQETRKDEDRLKRFLEMRRLKRRLRLPKPPAK